MSLNENNTLKNSVRYKDVYVFNNKFKNSSFSIGPCINFTMLDTNSSIENINFYNNSFTSDNFSVNNVVEIKANSVFGDATKIPIMVPGGVSSNLEVVNVSFVNNKFKGI